MDAATARRPLPHCPQCRSENLTMDFDGDTASWRCAGCDACWHVAFGRVHRVDRTLYPEMTVG